MESGKILWMSLAVLFSFIASVSSLREPAAKQLFHDLMKKQVYNRLIKPSGGPSAKLTVKIGLRLSQLLNVDEKNQIMTTSVWLRQQWYDPRLRWDPNEYGGVTKLHIPSNDLWRPDIVLYNNADGEFVITLMTKATVFSNGHIVWEPPAIYKSYCPIDVEFFPFDMQECFLKFSSWTYDGTELDLQHICDGVEMSSDGNGKNQEVVIPRGIDLKDYYFNVEWDVINVTARRKNKFYPCCSEPYPDIMFNITLRRRTLFYTLNLIMPCISISCLTILVFYLPSDSGEKITLSISILLALTVFFLLLAEIIPPTSLVIPLIGKYLLFIMIVVTMSIFLTVYTLHINFKTPTTAEMSPWVRRVFTEILPKILFIKRPHLENSPTLARQSCNGIDSREEGSPPKDWHTYENLRQHTPPEGQEAPPPPRPVRVRYPREVSEALAGVKFIANHITKADEENAEVQDWKYIAMVMDRLFLYIFTTACFSGTVSIFLYAPSLYDHRQPMDLIDLNSSCVY